jgi:hypothetical protein
VEAAFPSRASRRARSIVSCLGMTFFLDWRRTVVRLLV